MRFSFLILIAIAVSCNESNQNDNKLASVKWDSLIIKKPKKNVDTLLFGFTNNGNLPLRIERVYTDCGCTVPEYNKGEVLPGRRDTVKVVLSNENNSVLSRSVYVSMNTLEKVYELEIKTF